jgi:hypothetical protein
MSQRFANILNRPMNRKQFLYTLGLGFVSLVGLSALMGVLDGKDPASSSGNSQNGFGGGLYGGNDALKQTPNHDY